MNTELAFVTSIKVYLICNQLCSLYSFDDQACFMDTLYPQLNGRESRNLNHITQISMLNTDHMICLNWTKTVA